MTGGGQSRWSRRFVALSAAFLVAWQLGAFVGVPRRAEVTLALFGFVFHVVFGMAYLLVPSYFRTVLTTDRAPAAHLAFSASGTVLLAVAASGGVAAFGSVPPFVELVGAGLWCAGVVVFLAALLWSIRDNLLRRQTGTTAERAEHEWVDRYANRFVPVSFAYLGVGSYELLARASPLPGLTDGYAPRITHLLAAGFVALLVFALGVRLAPRFLGVPAPKSLTAVVLPAGAIGPGLVAVGLSDGPAFVAGAVAETTAFVGFAAVYLAVYRRSDQRRVGSGIVLLGVLCGVLAVSVGLSFALGPLFGLSSLSTVSIAAHRKLNLLGFFGLTVVGFVVQFFPPTAGRFRGANERTVRLSVGALAGGLGLSVVGQFVGSATVVTIGDGVAVVGALGYWYLLSRLLVGIGARQTE